MKLLANSKKQLGNGGALNDWTPAQKVFALAGFLFVVTAAVFSPALQNGFVNFDDPLYVTENARTQSGLSLAGLRWAATAIVDGNWHPLTLLSHQLDCQLFGLHPWGHHLSSILLHALNAALLFVVLQRLTGTLWRSFFVAALFGLHPLRVESVAWVAERKDVLSGLFWMLTLWSYARFVEEHKSRSAKAEKFYALALLFFCLGLMSKPMLVTLPFVLLLLDYWPLKRLESENIRRLIFEKLPFFFFSAFASAVAFITQKHDAAITYLAAPGRLENALVAYARYCGKLFWPENLSAYYPYPDKWPLAAVIGAAALLAMISAIALFRRREQPYLLVGWFWFLGTLVPVIGLIQVGLQSMADRYTYLPQIGLLILLVWGIHALAGHWRVKNSILFAGGIVVMAFLSILTFRQIHFWQNSETLFRHAIAVTDDNYVARVDLGIALEKSGRLDEAVEQFQTAISLKPAWSLAYENFAGLLNDQNRHEEALAIIAQALVSNPGDATLHDVSGGTLDKLGRTDEAIGQYQEAIKLNPNNADAHGNLGVDLGRKGLPGEAIRELQVAVELAPDSADAHYNFGNALVRAGRFDEAIEQFKKTLNLKPGDVDAHNNLGVALLHNRRFDEAIEQFQEALNLNPGYAEAKKNLAAAKKIKNTAGQPAISPKP